MSDDNKKPDAGQPAAPIASPDAGAETASPPQAQAPAFTKRRALLLSGLVLALALGSWLMLHDRGPRIDPNSPAAQLQRDDAAKQAKAQADLEAAKAGKTPPKEPRLFLSTSLRNNAIKEGLWQFQFNFEINKDKCYEYSGSFAECRELFSSLTIPHQALKTEPQVPGNWNLHKWTYARSFEAYFTLPLASLPDTDKVATLRVTPPALGKNVEFDVTAIDVPLPGWKLDTKLSKLFPDPENPRRLLVQAAITSSLPLNRESLEKRLHFSLQGKEGIMGSPEGKWTDDSSYVVTLPVTQLPGETGSLTLTLDKGVLRAKGGQSAPAGKQSALTIPGRNDFVAVDSLGFNTLIGDDALARPTIIAEFTAPVKSDAVIKSLTAKLLPLYRTAEDQKTARPFDWSTLEEIPDDVLAKAPLVSLVPEPQKDEYSDRFAFSYKAPAGRYMVIYGTGGIASNTGYSMPGPWLAVRQVPEVATELRFMQEGHILTLNGARKLALASRGLDSVEWQAWRVRPDYLNLLVNKSSTFTEPDIRSYSIDMEEISDSLEGSIPLGDSDGIAPQFSTLDLGPWMEKGTRGIFQITLKGKKGRSTQESIERFVLITDLGLVIKKDLADGRAVFVTSLAKGGPIAGAEVRVIARNGVALMSKTTDASGRADLPDLDGFSRERRAVAIEVRHAGDMTYMPLDDYKSRIPVRGERSGSRMEASGLSIFAFSERGIYRPGETLRFGLIAKNADWDPKAAATLPLTVHLLDPTGKKVMEKVVPLSPEGIGEVSLLTREESPTGRYYLEVGLGKRVMGSTSVQVEEFQPDRIKVTSRIHGTEAGADGPAKGWMLPQDLKAEVRVENLYGTPAKGSTVQASYSATRATEGFIRYKDYTFSSPAPKDAAYYVEGKLGEQTTDDTGMVRYPLPVSNLENATYIVRFQAEGFEAGGGRSVLSRARAIVSPYTQFIGWRSNANLDFLAKDAPADVEFIALGHKGDTVDSGPLVLKIRVVDYTSVLVRQNSGAYRYEQQRQTRVVENRTLSIGKDGLKLPLPTNNTGEHELVLEDASGIVRSALNFTVAGGADRWQGLKRDATLRIRLDKESYKAGEEIQVYLSAPYAGSGLITLESDRVLAHAWFTASTTDSVQRIAVPKDFEGRGFLLVHMLRDMGAKEIHMAPASHAIAPFYANMDRRDLGLRLTTPEKVLPGEVMQIGVSAAKPGKALVFAVDEGILQLTSYQNPSPLTYFLREKSHGVRGLQNWNQLMPEYGLVQRESAFGGDLAAALANRLNPFRRKAEGSVVYWSGLVDVGPEAKPLSWTVPAYFNGRLRVLAVAAGKDGVGEYASKTLARAPVIITPNLPVAVAPGDSFDVTVALANNLEGNAKSAAITLGVELDEGLIFETKPERSLVVPKGGEGRVSFRLKATERLGEATVSFSASVGEGDAAQTARRPISLSVRPAVPRMTTFAAGRLKNGEQAIPVARELYPHYAQVQASLSGLPLPLVDGLARYLTEFPHGCTEQILSAAFPYALLHGNADLLPLPKGKTAVQARQEAAQAVAKAVQTLRARQIKPGRYALWPQQGGTYPFLTVYGLDFMLAAKEAGFSVPDTLLTDSAKETRTLLQGLPNTLNEARVLAYAAWVYTRAGQTGLGERFRDISRLIKHCDETLPGWRRDVSAALLAGTYALMRQTKEAEALLKDVAIAGADTKTPWSGDGWFITPLWANGLYMSVLTAQFPERMASPGGRDLLIALVNDVGASRYTTTGAVQAVRGITGYATAAMRKKDTASAPALRLVALDSEHKPLPLESAGTLVKRLATGNQAAEFLFAGAEGLFWQITSDGFDRVLPPGNTGKKLDLKIDYLPVDGKLLKDLKQGDEVHVLVHAKTTTGLPMDNIAITSLLPGGFEMVISKGGQLVGAGSGGTGESGLSAGDGPRAYPSAALMGDVQAMLAEAKQSGLSPMPLVHVERREDRMVLFTSLDKQERAFIFRIKAVNKGRFSLPAAFAEALYDPDARARTGVGIVEVQ